MNKRKKITIRKHKDKNGGHYHVIGEELVNDYISVGLTTQSTKGSNSKHKNYKLEYDPLGTNKKSYLRKQGIIDKKINYSKETRKGSLSDKDYAYFREVIRKTKNKKI